MTSVSIVGGGIGGLMSAIALRRAGLDVTVYEQAPELGELGAGLGLFPNAIGILTRHGFREQIEKVGVRQDGQAFRNWRTGKTIATVDESGFESTFGSPRYTMRRSGLLAMLVSRVPAETIRLGTRLVDLEDVGDRVHLRFADGATVTSDFVIGADGIGSVIADRFGLSEPPTPTGYATYRALVRAEDVPQVPWDALTTSWFGPHSHFSSYWVTAESGEPLLNVMATVQSPYTAEERPKHWTAPADAEAVAKAFTDWHLQVRQVLDTADLTLFGLHQRPVRPRWNVGRIAVLGDAAHAMLPFFAQGAAMAIEDAETLAVLVRDVGPADIPARLAAYSAVRWERVDRCQRTAARYAVQWELPDGPEQEARDLALAGTETREGGEGLFDSAAWLYGHDVEQAVAEALAEGVEAR